LLYEELPEYDNDEREEEELLLEEEELLLEEEEGLPELPLPPLPVT